MLSERLKKVLEYIQIDDIIVDVGCDHGYLAKEALLKGVSFVQLVDNKKMPLKKAMDNLRELQTPKKIVYTCASGLTKIEDEVNVACICGMGGDLIARILKESYHTAIGLNRLILQPNTKADHLRKYLSDAHFTLLDETIVKERKKFYHIIVAKYDKNSVPLTELEIKYGSVLLQKRELIFIEYLRQRLYHIEEIMHMHPQSSCLLAKVQEKQEIEEILNDEIK